MNHKVLNRIETLFWEIANFYVKWNAGWENIIPDLVEHPTVKRRMDANQPLRNKVILQVVEKVEFTCSPFAVYERPNVKRVGFEKKPIISKAYNLSGKDVYSWLYFDRIVLLGDQEFRMFRNEIRDIKTHEEERSRVDWLLSFRNLLNLLSEQLTTLDSMPVVTFDQDQIEDWPDIDKHLRSFANDNIKPLINQYDSIIKKYLPEQQVAKSEKAKSTDADQDPLLTTTLPVATSVKRKQRQPKRQNTLDKDLQTLTYFREQIRTGIGNALRLNQEPDQKQILKLARELTVNRKMISGEKLRKDITPTMQAELFGKIYREELELNMHYISKLK